MNKPYAFILPLLLLLTILLIQWGVSDNPQSIKERKLQVDTRIDNNKYWQEMAARGLAILNPPAVAGKAVYTGSRINANSVITLDSPDIAVSTGNSIQSENSVFVNPNDFLNPLVSNNSSENPFGNFSGANNLYSFDGGESWDGDIYGAGTKNGGDPTTAINNKGRYFIGYITNELGQGISWSDDQGVNWTTNIVANSGEATVLDKNHLWIDNSTDSPFEGYLYNAWTPIGGSGHVNLDQIEVSVSSDEGESWTTPVGISQAAEAGKFNHGVNLSTGPNGEVYAVWAIYDSWPSDESALGFARSFDGGSSWEPAYRIIENIRGIRTTGTSKDMRVNSFPVAAVDISNGPGRGNIYVVWSNTGVPGINQGADIDVYLIKSADQGVTWSEPLRINQDEPGQGNEHYFPWVTCDPVNGDLSVIFYDDRNTNDDACEVFCANSFDGGENWEDFKVSDVSFTPAPIEGMAQDYFGDYLGISAHNGIVYPVWTDNRTGAALTYTSPYKTNSLASPYSLEGVVSDETGTAVIRWRFDGGTEFEHFNIYRNHTLLGSSADTFFVDPLPDHGRYTYQISAIYTGGGESIPASMHLQWGDAKIAASQLEIYQVLKPGDSTEYNFTLFNIGELPLHYKLFPSLTRDYSNSKQYCEATSEYCDEYISRVQIGIIDKPSGCSNYEDNTDLYTIMHPEYSYPITIENGKNDSPNDYCAVWIDWNQNESFEEEESIDLEGSPGPGPYTGMIIPPLNAQNGFTRMRVRLNYNEAPEPCGITFWGEVEDYSILFSKWLRIGNYAGVLSAGDSIPISFELNAKDLEAGLYRGDLIFQSNDPNLPEMYIPVDLLVTDFEITATADKDSVCPGTAVQLFADTSRVNGDTVLYEWTSIPKGYNSIEKEPVFDNIHQNTSFIVEATDQLGSVYDTVNIAMLTVPDADLGNDTLLCSHETIILYPAYNANYTYTWMNGSTENTLLIDSLNFGTETVKAWVEVASDGGCIAADTVEISFKDCTGIDELSGNSNILIYPNPGNGLFRIQMHTEHTDNWNLKIFNQISEIIWEGNVEFSGNYRKAIDLRGHSSGVYYLMLKSEKGNKVIKKIIIR